MDRKQAWPIGSDVGVCEQLFRKYIEASLPGKKGANSLLEKEMGKWSFAFLLFYVVVIIATTFFWKRLRMEMIETFQNCHHPLDMSRITDLRWRKVLFQAIASAAALCTLSIFLLLGEENLYAIGSVVVCGLVTIASFLFIERARFSSAERYIDVSQDFQENYPTALKMRGFIYIWHEGLVEITVPLLSHALRDAFQITQGLKKEDGIYCTTHVIYLKSVIKEGLDELREIASSNREDAFQARLALLEIPPIQAEQEKERAVIIAKILLEGNEKEQKSLQEVSRRSHEYIRIAMQTAILMKKSATSPPTEEPAT